MVLDTAFIGKKKPSVFSKEYLLGLLAEIKTYDLLNNSIASLIGHIRDRVASDTKEEIEDIAETKITDADAKWSAKYNDALAIIDSMKVDISSQNGIISDLQKQNETLAKEIAQLKSIAGQYSTNDVERADILQEPEVVYGSKPADREQNDRPDEDKPLTGTSDTVDGYTSGKKGRKAANGKSGTAKQKSASKALQKTANKTSEEIIGKAATETPAPAQDFMTRPSSENGGGSTLFD